MKQEAQALEIASLQQYCRAARLPAVAAHFVRLAGQAAKENHTYIRYLEALLQVEYEERDRHAVENRVRDAQFPRVKKLDDFDYSKTPLVPAARIRELAEGGYIERSEPVVLIGDGDPATFCTSAYVQFLGPREGEYLAADEISFMPAADK